MKTIITGCNKGGSSKTTTAVNMGVELSLQKNARGELNSVYIIDADKQCSAMSWGKAREALGRDDIPQVTVAYRDGNLSPFIRSLDGKYDFVIVDVTGSISKELITAMAVADVLIAPYKCSMYDLNTIYELNEQVNLAVNTLGNEKLKTLVYQTMASTNHVIKPKERANFEAFTSNFHDLKLMKAYSSHRQAFIDTAYNGLGVSEMANSSAKREIKALVREVLSYV